MTDPSMHEILRRLDEQSRNTDRLVQRVDQLVEKMEERYLSKGEYLADRRGDDHRIKSIEQDIASAQGWRRQVTASGLVGGLLLIASTALNIAMARGGA